VSRSNLPGLLVLDLRALPCYVDRLPARRVVPCNHGILGGPRPRPTALADFSTGRVPMPGKSFRYQIHQTVLDQVIRPYSRSMIAKGASKRWTATALTYVSNMFLE